MIGAALARIHAMIEEGVDRMKTDASEAPLIAVSDGSFLVPPRLAGVSEASAVEAGADPATLTVVEVEDLPLSYMPGNSLRTRVRVVGEIAH
jgi:hypothetical protein